MCHKLMPYLQNADRAERRARNECPYEISPSAQMLGSSSDDAVKSNPPGYLGTYDVDCKKAGLAIPFTFLKHYILFVLL